MRKLFKRIGGSNGHSDAAGSENLNVSRIPPIAPVMNDYLAAVPRLDSLADLPAGTPVLVRGDVDAKPGASIGEGDIRLRSMVETLKHGVEKGWKQIVFGHIGRKPEGSLEKVAQRLGELLGADVPLVDNWFDDATGEVSGAVTAAIEAAVVPDSW